VKKVVIKGGQKVRPIMKPSHSGGEIYPLNRSFAKSGWRDLNSRPLDPSTSAPCPGTSTDIQLSLKIGTLYSGAFRWTNANGGQNGGQTTAKVSEVACLAMSGTTAVEDLPAWASIRAPGQLHHWGRRCVTGWGRRSENRSPLHAGWRAVIGRSSQPGCLAIGLRRI
jgi:hypothetical protein